MSLEFEVLVKCLVTASILQIGTHCSDRNFAYQMVEQLHDPWVKRLFIGFARTSDFNGPRKPKGPHPLIQEIDSELPVFQPALQLTYSIFGSCPPMQSFDPAKLLTVGVSFSSHFTLSFKKY